MQPTVALWTIYYHSAVVALLAASFVCVVLRSEGLVCAADSGTEAVAGAGGIFLAHFLLWGTLLVGWSSDRDCRLPWDALSVGTAAIACAAHPWVGVWASQSIGGHWAQAQEAQRDAILRTAALSIGFAAYVPVTLSRWLLIPLASIASYAVLAGTVDTSEPCDVPALLGTLCLPLLALGGNLRRREVCERAALEAEALYVERREIQESEPDLAFFLSEDCCLLRTTPAVHDGLLGQKAEGLCFASLLAPKERVRLQELLDEVELSGDARALETCTLRLPRGEVQVGMTVALLDPSRTGDDGATFRVGLVIAAGTPQQPQQQEVQRLHDPPAITIVAPAGSERLHPMPEALSFEAVVPVGTGGWRRTISRSGDLDLLDVHRMISDLPMSAPSQGGVSEVGTFILSESTYRFSRPTTKAASTQTEEPLRAEVAVNTSVVMDGFSFRCLACSKPPAPRLYSPGKCAPVVPGPRAQALIEKLDRQKGVSRGSPSMGPRRNTEPAIALRPTEGAHTYKGRSFDGTWEAHPDCARSCSDWLRRFSISAGRVVLGDGAKTKLVQCGAEGVVYLCDGEVRIQKGGGRLYRQGRGGRIFEFVLVGPPEEAAHAAESAEDVVPPSSDGRRPTK